MPTSGLSGHDDIADLSVFDMIKMMWPRDRTEWRLSFIGWLVAMVALVAFGGLVAALFAIGGASALMVRRWAIDKR